MTDEYDPHGPPPMESPMPHLQETAHEHAIRTLFQKHDETQQRIHEIEKIQNTQEHIIETIRRDAVQDREVAASRHGELKSLLMEQGGRVDEVMAVQHMRTGREQAVKQWTPVLVAVAGLALTSLSVLFAFWKIVQSLS